MVNSRTIERRPTPVSATTLESLETLRIVAALLVVFAHIPPYDIPLLGLFLGANFFLGSIGVDIFFVISGVVIGFSTIRSVSEKIEQKPLARFLIARAFRILPLYWAITVLKVFILWFRDGVLPRMEELLHSFFLIPRLDQFQYVDPIVSVGWTLQFEIFFYLLCALGIACRSKYLPLLAALVIVAVSFAWDQYYLNPILLEFAGGYGLALYLSAYRPEAVPLPRWRAAVFATGAIVLLLFAAVGRDYGYMPSGTIYVPRMMIVYGEIMLPRWIAWGIPALILITIACRLESAIRWPFAFLGKYTYSVYLCHGIAIAIMLKISTSLGIESTAWTLLLLPIILLVAVGASFRLIELPMIYLGKNLTDRYRSFRATS